MDLDLKFLSSLLIFCDMGSPSRPLGLVSFVFTKAKITLVTIYIFNIDQIIEIGRNMIKYKVVYNPSLGVIQIMGQGHCPNILTIRSWDKPTREGGVWKYIPMCHFS